VVQILVPRSHNPIHENELNFTTSCITRTRAFHSERSLGALRNHDDDDAGWNMERATNVNDGMGRCFDAYTCSNSKRTRFKCLELHKPTYLEPMSTHHVNLALCWQTFISPTLMASLNHKKNGGNLTGAEIQIFVVISQSCLWKQAEFYNMLHRSFPFRMIFLCTSKLGWGMTLNQTLKGKQIQTMVWVDFLIPSLAHGAPTSLHACGVEHAMFVLVPPANMTYVKNTQLKSKEFGWWANRAQKIPKWICEFYVGLYIMSLNLGTRVLCYTQLCYCTQKIAFSFPDWKILHDIFLFGVCTKKLE